MRYTYKPTSKYQQPIKTTRWKTWGTVFLTAVLFVLATSLAFPNYVERTGISLPESWKSDFRLGLDLQGGTHLVYEADMSGVAGGEELDALEGVKDVVERRVNAFGVSEPVVQTTSTGGSHRVIIELAGVLDVNEAITLIGETPILEFKEPSINPSRELTEEELAELEALQATDTEAAQAVLDRALDGEDFASLVSEFSVDQYSKEQGGDMGWLSSANQYFGVFAQEVEEAGTHDGRVHAELVESLDGLNVLKLEESKDAEDFESSHILICFEGKTGCTEQRTELDASILINSLKEQATVENFADLARDNSDDASNAADGGYLGWHGPGEFVPAFELAALSTPVGEVSEVVETEFGYHIILKTDATPIKAYKISRILMPYASATDVVPADPWKNTELSGRHLTRSNVDFDQTTGQPYVVLHFNSDGDKLFGELTEAHVGEQIAIFLDGEVITAPVVQTAIYGGQAIITGSFTIEEAKLLAQRLNAGALPVPLNLMSQQTVGPTLGQISLSKSIMAALIGFLFVGLYMMVYYRLPGVLAVIALVMYAAFNLAIYKLLGVTITLAGIAGFILSLGMAVDANVLIFERFREELKSGRDILGAIDEGFRRAWTSIRDGNITTLIAAGILFWFSTSFIKGFALTLAIGILLSMFTAITVTRVYLRLISAWRAAKPMALYGVKRNPKEE
ncbi:MAG: protein translocase subunit SecD [Candidatus Uhrbacteria bacterium]|nr:protein translocase subunit SecD [Patescibacteria group bacterium]MBU1907128.1 protein translocase subunit SecD [Patescibacteria group bacterium]